MNPRQPTILQGVNSVVLNEDEMFLEYKKTMPFEHLSKGVLFCKKITYIKEKEK